MNFRGQPPKKVSPVWVAPTLGLEDRMPFGKHMGKTVDELIRTDAPYLLWVIEEVDKVKIADDLHDQIEEAAAEQRTYTGGIADPDQFGDFDY